MAARDDLNQLLNAYNNHQTASNYAQLDHSMDAARDNDAALAGIQREGARAVFITNIAPDGSTGRGEANDTLSVSEFQTLVNQAHPGLLRVDGQLSADDMGALRRVGINTRDDGVITVAELSNLQAQLPQQVNGMSAREEEAEASYGR